MAKVKKDALSPSSQIGKELIREALSDFKGAQKKMVVKQVSDIMERVNLMERVQAKTERRMKLLKAQLEAINHGKFKFVSANPFADTPGQGPTGTKIQFDDEELNIDWSATERW